MERCCFTGHRIIPTADAPALLQKLDLLLSHLYAQGVREFRTGGALGFDTVAALRVLALREKHADCRLVLILPCATQSQGWSKKDRLVYEHIRAKADEERVLFSEYTPECMHARNRALVDGCDICVAYLTRNRGGTLYTCSYALKNDVALFNLATDPLTEL